MESAAESLEQRAEREEAAYAGEAARPLGSYAGLLALYGAGVAGLSGVVRRRRHRYPLPDGRDSPTWC